MKNITFRRNCPVCGKSIALTPGPWNSVRGDLFQVHNRARAQRCPASGHTAQGAAKVAELDAKLR